jgi:hypothetical protein
MEEQGVIRVKHRAVEESQATPVFESKPVATPPQQAAYVPFDALTVDDDLVYSVPNAEPVLLTLSSNARFC